MDYTKTTLGALLSSDNETIKRNAISILKQLQGKNKQTYWGIKQGNWQKVHPLDR